jgi:hypothetical protein
MAQNYKIRYLQRYKTDIYKSIGVFQGLEIEVNQKYISAKNGLQAPYRRKLDLRHSTDLTLVKGMLKDTIDIYIKRVINIYDFEALKKKEKKNQTSYSADSDSDYSLFY